LADHVALGVEDLEAELVDVLAQVVVDEATGRQVLDTVTAATAGAADPVGFARLEDVQSVLDLAKAELV
jgi:LDH2 family malate/lactate/ureidoglycolate dehydrogenase